MNRICQLSRKTGETDVKLDLNLDGEGKNNIDTPSGFFNHMLTLFSRHSLIDLDINAAGDVDVDFHHLVEDTGIVLGKAVLNALGDKKGINRYGSFYVPMDEALGFCSIDISGRPFLVFDAEFETKTVGNFDVELVEEFFRGFVNNAQITIHIRVIYGKNTHHMIEAIFKVFGRALRQAISFDKREKGLPSTKGVL